MVDLKVVGAADTLEEQAFANAYDRYRRDAFDKLKISYRSLPISSLCSVLAQARDISLEACKAVWAKDIRERRVYVWESAGNLAPDYIREWQETPAEASLDREEECRKELYGDKYPSFDRNAVLEALADKYPFARRLLQER